MKRISPICTLIILNPLENGVERKPSNSIKSREKVFPELVFRHPLGLRSSEL